MAVASVQKSRWINYRHDDSHSRSVYVAKTRLGGWDCERWWPWNRNRLIYHLLFGSASIFIGRAKMPVKTVTAKLDHNPDEVEITSQMIEAGETVLLETLGGAVSEHWWPRDLAVSVFRATASQSETVTSLLRPASPSP